MKDPSGQFNSNIIRESIKAFGVVPVAYETLIDLTSAYTGYINTHLIITNSLDEDVTIKIGDNEITVQAFKDTWMDGLRYDGIIQYKYKTAPSTEGSLQIVCY